MEKGKIDMHKRLIVDLKLTKEKHYSPLHYICKLLRTLTDDPNKNL